MHRLAILILGLAACGRGENPEPTSEPPARERPSERVATPACSTEPASRCPAEVVPLVRLLARPEDYDGKRVVVMGFAHYEFEGNGLYPHRDDAENGLYFNGLWLDAPSPSVANADSLSDQYVFIEGTFEAQNRGHLGMWSGAIVKVTRAQRWPPF